MSPMIRDKRSLTIYVFTVLAFAFYGYLIGKAANRAEDNTEEIKRQRLESCLNGIVILEAFNNQQRELISITVGREDLPGEIKRKYVKAYTDAIVEPLPTCSTARKNFQDEKENNK